MKKFAIIVMSFILSVGLSACRQDLNDGSTGGRPQGPEDGDNVESSEELAILFTNDLHSQIEPLSMDASYNADKGGVARIKVLIDSVRTARNNAVIVADAGDFVQGTWYFTCFDGEVEMKIQKELGYDGKTIGNHEFDKKMNGLGYMLSLNEVTAVSSNYDFSGTPLSSEVCESVIIERAGHKIGFIGLGPRLFRLVDPLACEGVVYSQPLDVADGAAARLKEEGAEMVIALSHLGFNDDTSVLYNDGGVAANTRNIDVIIGGHSHTFLTKPFYVRNLDEQEVPIVQTGSRGIYLGSMTIDFTKVPGRDRFSYRLIPVNSRLDNRIDPAFAGILSLYSDELEESMNEILGYCPEALGKGYPQGLLGNWAADALAVKCEEIFGVIPDLAVCNNGGLRAEISAGDVMRKDIYAVFPFDNKLTLIDIKGSTLLEFFDNMASSCQPLSSSVRLKISDMKVAEVKVGGKAIDPEKTYRVCTLDYLVNSNHYHLGEYISRQDSFEFVYDIICDYVCELTSQGLEVGAEIDDRAVNI